MSPPSEPGTVRAALLTPLGPAGITVVQVVGPGAADLVGRILRDAKARQIMLGAKAGKIYHGYIVEQSGERVDEVVVCLSRLAEKGLEAVDICCHGGVRPGQKVMEVLAAAGACPVQGKDLPGGGLAELVDLAGGSYEGLAGEVLSRLCRAGTELTVRILLEQLHGGLRAELQRLLNEEMSAEQLRQAIDRLLGSWNWGRRLTNPPAIAITGAANAGKSALANLLSGRQGSIVTSQAGTTRDWVTHQTSLEGLSVVLIDTPGHRDAVDALEIEAIRRAAEQSRRADVQLLVIDGSNRNQTVPELCPGIKTIIALNKVDLKGFSDEALPSELAHWPCVKTSAVTGQGRNELSVALLKALDCERLCEGGPMVFTERQSKCLQRAAQSLKHTKRESLSLGKEMLLECLRG